MALPLPPGLTPPEVAFLCEMENVTIVPRQKLDSIELLGVSMMDKSTLRVVACHRRRTVSWATQR